MREVTGYPMCSAGRLKSQRRDAGRLAGLKITANHGQGSVDGALGSGGRQIPPAANFSLMWPFHTHRWKIVSAHTDQCGHWLTRGECGGGPSGHFGVTHVAMRCSDCGALQEKSIRGCHTLESLQGSEVAKALEYMERQK